MLQNAVNPVEELRIVKTQAEQMGVGDAQSRLHFITLTAGTKTQRKAARTIEKVSTTKWTKNTKRKQRSPPNVPPSTRKLREKDKTPAEASKKPAHTTTAKKKQSKQDRFVLQVANNADIPMEVLARTHPDREEAHKEVLEYRKLEKKMK